LKKQKKTNLYIYIYIHIHVQIYVEIDSVGFRHESNTRPNIMWTNRCGLHTLASKRVPSVA
jgi:hypothetical protein